MKNTLQVVGVLGLVGFIFAGAAVPSASKAVKPQSTPTPCPTPYNTGPAGILFPNPSGPGNLGRVTSAIGYGMGIIQVFNPNFQPNRPDLVQVVEMDIGSFLGRPSAAVQLSNRTSFVIALTDDFMRAAGATLTTAFPGPAPTPH